MRATDADISGSDRINDYVDAIFLNFDFGDLSPGDDFSTPATYTSHVGYFNTTLSFRVFCAENYYDPMCTTMCDADIPGNFTCNATGALVCATNYYGPNCTNLCIETANFVCNENGSQVCAENYYGSQCDVLCEPKINSMCDENGSRICDARNDSMGHYSCGGDGNRVCLAGYQNPSTFCIECILADGCCKWNIIFLTAIYGFY